MKTIAYKTLMSFRKGNTGSNMFPEKSLKDIFGDTKITGATGGTFISEGNPGFSGNLFNDGSNKRPTSYNSGNIWQLSLDIGSGNTAATENDYCLESPIDLSFSSKSYNTPILDENNNIIGSQLSVTYINNTASEVTIREIGAYLRAYFNSGGSNYDWFLIERTVLETPIVVPVNGTVTVAFNTLY